MRESRLNSFKRNQIKGLWEHGWQIALSGKSNKFQTCIPLLLTICDGIPY